MSDAHSPHNVGVLRAEGLSRAGFSHAFFTRESATGEGFSFATSEAAESTARNVDAAARTLGIAPPRLYFASQVHGRDVVCITGHEDRADVLRQRADAVISRSAQVGCAVRIADCVPVLVADRASGAVAAIHSGWQGTVLGVVDAGVAALRRHIDARGELIAAIFPHIGACCFEVGEDVAQKLLACSTAPAAEVVDRSRGSKPRIDLRRVVRAQLRAIGVSDAHIEDVPGCTVCDSARFFSYRRDKEKSGRHLAAVVPRPPEG